MKTLQEVRSRCRIEFDDDHWLWTGATNKAGDTPIIYAPDLSRAGAMRVQTGPRAIWQMHTGKAIPGNHRVFRTCSNKMCLNPACMVCSSTSSHGARIAKSGKLKGCINRIVASRITGRKLSVLTHELIREIQASNETGVALAARLGFQKSVVQRAKKGGIVSFQPVGGVFSGLLAR